LCSLFFDRAAAPGGGGGGGGAAPAPPPPPPRATAPLRLLQARPGGGEGGPGGRGEPRAFRVDYALACQELQLRTVSSVVSERYEPHASRLLRMLLERGLLDEKAIAERAMLEPKGARRLLFRMVADGLLTLQELPRRPDRNPQHTTFLFSAHWDRVLALLADHVCRGVFFMRVRHRMEAARLAAARRDGLAHYGAGGGAGAGGGLLSGAEGGASSEEGSVLRRMQAGVDKLEASILRCDESLFVLSEL
jgi:hypothetical protein